MITFFAAASGYRDSSDGTLFSVGSYGASWVASPNVANTARGGYLSFVVSSVGPASYNGRTYGFPARCVQELMVK